MRMDYDTVSLKGNAILISEPARRTADRARVQVSHVERGAKPQVTQVKTATAPSLAFIRNEAIRSRAWEEVGWIVLALSSLGVLLFSLLA